MRYLFSHYDIFQEKEIDLFFSIYIIIRYENLSHISYILILINFEI